MLETVTLITFAAMLMTSVSCRLPLLAALLVGWLLFFDYGLLRGYDMAELARMSLKGLRGIVPVLTLFALIGALTASWRAAGTIPAIICWSVGVMTPSTLALCSFLLCAAMSMLTGSSFAAAATTGVICMTISSSMGAHATLTGGAILSGSFFGECCSPMSSSASLVSGITKTDLYDNVNRMARSCVVPFALCSLLYGALGLAACPRGGLPPELVDGIMQASRSLDLSPVALLPVIVVLVLCLLRASIRVTMLASLVAATAVCVCVRHMAPADLLQAMLFGFHAADPAVARLSDGGGISSMAEIAAIVAVASTYSGLFEGTGLIEGMDAAVSGLSRKTTPFAGVLLTSVVTTAIACDQVISIMLVRQLCGHCEGSDSALALDMGNSVTLMPALIPWSTSYVGIMAFTGIPATSVACAFLPILMPIWMLALSLWQHGHPTFVDGSLAHAMGLTDADDLRRLAA